jgi:hypothetical protein
MEAKRRAQWERWGCEVFRSTLDYSQGDIKEKGVDVRLATTLTMDCVKGKIDLAVIISADKDYRFAIIQAIEEVGVKVEVAIWRAVNGGKNVGRIRIAPERDDLDELEFHPLSRSDFNRVKDNIDYRNQPVPDSWNGPVPDSRYRPGARNA